MGWTHSLAKWWPSQLLSAALMMQRTTYLNLLWKNFVCSDFTFLYTVHVCHILSFVISFTLSCIFYMQYIYFYYTDVIQVSLFYSAFHEVFENTGLLNGQVHIIHCHAVFNSPPRILGSLSD